MASTYVGHLLTHTFCVEFYLYLYLSSTSCVQSGPQQRSGVQCFSIENSVPSVSQDYRHSIIPSSRWYWNSES